MQEKIQNPQTDERQAKASPATIGVAAAVTVAVLVGFWFLFQPMHGRRAALVQETVNLKMSPAEEEYARKIEIGNLALSRAENFLHKEVTILNGELYNGGTEPVVALSLTTEFLDDMNQVVLRETRRVLGTTEVALAPGARRTFEISFEHVPNVWNMQAPAIRISYLQLPAHKQ